MMALGKLRGTGSPMPEAAVAVVETADGSGKKLGDEVMKGAGQVFVPGSSEEVRSGGLGLTELSKEQAAKQRDIHRKGKDL